MQDFHEEKKKQNACLRHKELVEEISIYTFDEHISLKRCFYDSDMGRLRTYPFAQINFSEIVDNHCTIVVNMVQ